MSDPIINLAAAILGAAAELTIAISLTVAAARNHFRGHIRPIVGILGLYFWVSVFMDFLRIITRVYVLNGGDSAVFVNSWWYFAAIIMHMVVTWMLYAVLYRSYPETTTFRRPGM